MTSVVLFRGCLRMHRKQISPIKKGIGNFSVLHKGFLQSLFRKNVPDLRTDGIQTCHQHPVLF